MFLLRSRFRELPPDPYRLIWFSFGDHIRPNSNAITTGTIQKPPFRRSFINCAIGVSTSCLSFSMRECPFHGYQSQEMECTHKQLDKPRPASASRRANKHPNPKARYCIGHMIPFSPMKDRRLGLPGNIAGVLHPAPDEIPAWRCLHKPCLCALTNC